MRYVLECNWSGYTASQSRCCHREVITAKKAKEFEEIGVIRFGDNTHMSVNVRPARFREKVIECKGYSQLLWDVLKSGLKGSVSVNDIKKKEIFTGVGLYECDKPEHFRGRRYSK